MEQINTLKQEDPTMKSLTLESLAMFQRKTLTEGLLISAALVYFSLRFHNTHRCYNYKNKYRSFMTKKAVIVILKDQQQKNPSRVNPSYTLAT